MSEHRDAINLVVKDNAVSRGILYKNGNEFYKYRAATCSICAEQSNEPLYFCILCMTLNTQIDPPPAFCAQRIDLAPFLSAPRQCDVPIETRGHLCGVHNTAIDIQFPGLLILLSQIDNLICVEKKE